MKWQTNSRLTFLIAITLTLIKTNYFYKIFHNTLDYKSKMSRVNSINLELIQMDWLIPRLFYSTITTNKKGFMIMRLQHLLIVSITCCWSIHALVILLESFSKTNTPFSHRLGFWMSKTNSCKLVWKAIAHELIMCNIFPFMICKS